MMLRRLLLASAAIAAFTITTRAIADSYSPYKELLEWYEEQPIRSPTEAREHQKVLLNTFNGAQIAAVAQTGVTLTIYPIQYPLSGGVSGDNPGCGDGNISDAAAIGQAFIKGGVAMASAATSSGPGAPYVAALGGAIAAIGFILGGGSPHSDTASCGFASLVLPGHYSADEVRAIVSIHYQNNLGEPFQTVGPDQDVGWARVGSIESKPEDLRVDPKSDFGRTLALMKGGQLQLPSDNLPKCPQTLVLVQFKNWSDNRTRSVYLSGELNKAAIPDGACLDGSYINKFLYGAKYAQALGHDELEHYYKWLTDRIDHQVSAVPPQNIH